MSIFFLVGLFDLWSGLAIILANAAGAYALATHVKSPYMPWLAFIFLMGFMSVSHLYRQTATAQGQIDITGAQMVLVMKLTGFCWNISDGTKPISQLDSYQQSRALKSPPSVLDFLGFVFFFPSLFAGPAFDYAEYQRWLETSMFDLPPGTDPSKAPVTRKSRRIPRSGTPSAWKAVAGLAWILAFLQFSKSYNEGVVLGDSYLQYGFPRRVWLLHMLGFTTRMKYYGVWALTEGACILTGMGYKGIDPHTGKADWSRLVNVKPWGVELAQNTHAYLGNWNINTNNWLRNYVYLRVTPQGQKPGFGATMATFVTSAFWHGFFPGYYLSFILGSFLQNIAKSKPPLVSTLSHADLKTDVETHRCSPPFASILHVCRRQASPGSKALLRHRHLFHHPDRLFIHCLVIHTAQHWRMSQGLVTRILLLHHRYGVMLALPAHAWQAVVTASRQAISDASCTNGCRFGR